MNCFTSRAALICLHCLALFAAVPARAATLTATYRSATSVPVTASSYTATGSTVSLALQFAPATGTNLTVINNTGLDFIHGTFSNLAQGQAVTLSYGGVAYHFVANYYGGTGNDLVLQWADTMLAAWGDNYWGTLGNNSQDNGLLPVPVDTSGVLHGKTVTTMESADLYSLALCSDGTLAAWGYNQYGNLGTGNLIDSPVPVALDTSGALHGKRVVAIAAGDSHALVLCSDGSIAAWGDNTFGELGTGSFSSTGPVTTPVAVTMTGALRGKTVVSLAAGYNHSVALCSDGTLAAWGYNGQGQLGNGSTTDSLVPVAVDTSGALRGKTVVAIGAANFTTLALCSDGSLASWGYNDSDQLGNGSTFDSTDHSAVPVAVDTSGVLHGKTVVAFSLGGDHTLVLCADGTLAAWGYNGVGGLGNGTTTDSAVPVAVDQSGALAGRTVTAVSAGGIHGLARCSDGAVFDWGQGNYGDLGTGTTTDSLVPVEVSRAALLAGARFVAVTGGRTADFSLGLVALPPAYPMPAASRYAGSVQPGPDGYPLLGTEGLLTATVMANGTFSARLLMDGRTFAITGVFDKDGVAHFGKTRTTSLVLEPETSTSDMVITLHRDTDQQLSGAVTRTIQSNLESTSAIAAGRLFADGGTFDPSVPPEYLGKGGAPGVFSVVMPVSQQLYANLGTDEFPQGTGFGTLTIAKSGLATFIGTLADGATVTAATALTRRSHGSHLVCPLFAQLYNKGGFISDNMRLIPAPDSDLSAPNPDVSVTDPNLLVDATSVHWVRPAMNAQYYPKGWPIAVITQLFGAKHTATPGQSSLKAVGGGNYSANGYVYADLGLAPLAKILGYTPSLYLSPADIASPLWQSDGFSLSIDRSTGRFGGAFRDGNGAATAYQGILYQKGALAGGHGFYLTAPPKVIDGHGQSIVVNLTAQGR